MAREDVNSERCHKEGGHLIPGCMGVAAAFGCGLTDKQIMEFCTCRPRETTTQQIKRLEKRIKKLEEEVNRLKAVNSESS